MGEEVQREKDRRSHFHRKPEGVEENKIRKYIYRCLLLNVAGLTNLFKRKRREISERRESKPCMFTGDSSEDE